MTFELYSSKNSFYSLKAQLALRAKGVEYKVIEVGLFDYGNLQPWYLRINPAGKVPTLRDGRTLVPDSSAIIIYLDKTCGGNKLQPDSGVDVSKDVRRLYNRIDGIDIPTITLSSFVHPDLAAAVKGDTRKELFREHEGRPSWLFGLDITAADVVLVATLFRLSNLGVDKDIWVKKLPLVERYLTFAKENFPGFKIVTAEAF